MQAAGPSAPSIFISYSHEDRDWKDRLVRQLRVLQEEGSLAVWTDDEIEEGEDWRHRLEEALGKCDLAVLLVSAHSLTSDFILHKEVEQLLKRRHEEELPIVPVVVTPCLWERVSWLEQMQVRLAEGKPLSLIPPPEADEVLADIARSIHDRLCPSEQLSQTNGDNLAGPQKRTPGVPDYHTAEDLPGEDSTPVARRVLPLSLAIIAVVLLAVVIFQISAPNNATLIPTKVSAVVIEANHTELYIRFPTDRLERGDKLRLQVFTGASRDQPVYARDVPDWSQGHYIAAVPGLGDRGVVLLSVVRSGRVWLRGEPVSFTIPQE